MKKQQVTILPQAQDDLISIWATIAHDSKDESIADRFYNYLLDICHEKLAYLPKMGRERNDLRDGLRYHPLGNYDYNIFYSLREDEILIERIIWGAQDYKDFFN